MESFPKCFHQVAGVDSNQNPAPEISTTHTTQARVLKTHTYGDFDVRLRRLVRQEQVFRLQIAVANPSKRRESTHTINTPPHTYGNYKDMQERTIHRASGCIPAPCTRRAGIDSPSARRSSPVVVFHGFEPFIFCDKAGEAALLSHHVDDVVKELTALHQVGDHDGLVLVDQEVPHRYNVLVMAQIFEDIHLLDSHT